MITEILNYSNLVIDSVKPQFVRYLAAQINWEARLIEILGARGTGKTTLMLQKARELNSLQKNQAVYISLDDQLMYSRSIVDVTDELLKYGVKTIFLDEVHKYPSKQKNFDWSAEIKNIYDRYPSIKIVYSGSSVLKIYKGHGDLSRRKSSYTLSGLSFREYLELNDILKEPAYSLENIIYNHQQLSEEISKKVKIIPLFREYLKFGYFPFYNEDKSSYYRRLNSILNVVIETDIPAVSDLTFETSMKMKKLLAAIASTAPYIPNLLMLRNELMVTDQRTLLKYLDLLEKAEIIDTLFQHAKGNKILQKPGKIYLGNTNYFYALSSKNEETGTIREIFFDSQLRVNHELQIAYKTDFLVDEKFHFEIGGKNKTNKQIRDLPHSFVVQDDIEIGVFNYIPLWLFGFLY